MAVIPDADGLALLGPAELAALFNELERERRKAEARQLAVLAWVDRTHGYRADGHASTAGWCRALGRWSSGDATARIRTARVADRVDVVGEAVATGTIGTAQAQLLGRAAANPRCGKRIDEVAHTLVGCAPSLDYDEFHTVVQRWLTLADVDGAHRSAADTHDARSASVVCSTGRVHVKAEGPALEGVAMRSVFQRYLDAEFATDWAEAKKRYGTGATKSLLARTDAQRRFDAMEAIFRSAAVGTGGADPEPLVNIVVDLDTFAALLAGENTWSPRWSERRMDAGGCDTDGRVERRRRGAQAGSRAADLLRRRCETTDGTPLAPSEVLLAALAGRVRRVVVDDDGVVLDLGRRRRVFTGAVREAALLAAQKCIWPGCHLPADRCQVDHLEAWSAGGETRVDNGAPLCGRHNRWKHRGYSVLRDERGRWRTERPDGSHVG